MAVTDTTPLSAAIKRHYQTIALSEILPSGYAELDRCLPGGGWPAQCVTEIIAPEGYIDPVTVLLPALALLGEQRRWIGWLQPPSLPVAEDLAAQNIRLDRIQLIHPPKTRPYQTLKLLEQAISSANYSTLIAWPEQADDYQIRRLSAAARYYKTTVFLIRPAAAQNQPSSAELRVFVATHSHRLEIEILQSRCFPGVAMELPVARDRLLFTPRYYCQPQPARQRPALPGNLCV